MSSIRNQRVSIFDILPIVFPSPFLLRSSVKLDEMDIQLSKWWFKTLCGKDLIDHQIMLFISNYYKQHDKNFPTREELEKTFCVVDCMCEYAYPEDKVINMKKHMIYNFGRLFKNCRELEMVYEYELLNKKYPTKEELQTYITNIQQFQQDPETYFNNDKVSRPALSFSKEMIKQPNEEITENCSICFEQIKLSPYYELPCKHKFHSEEKECLENSGISTWFQKNNFCPNCKHQL